MKESLSIRSGQYSSKGRKAVNQDSLGVHHPATTLIDSKGIAVALADGISSSSVSQIASETAISSFFADYYSTSEAWSVKHSGLCVLNAINSWLYAQSRRSEFRYNLNKGYVCTFSAVIFKATTAHLFHAGDSRIYQLQGDNLECLTNEHRIYIDQEKHYLQRAMGMDQCISFDYKEVPIKVGSTLVLATDGIYEFLTDADIAQLCNQNLDNLDQAAQQIVQQAFDQGSDDNLSVQIVRVESIPTPETGELLKTQCQLPFPPVLKPRDEFDGFTISRILSSSARSHVYLAVDNATQKRVVIKAPAVDLQENTEHLERFLIEDWIAKRIDSAHVLKPCELDRAKKYFYIVTEYIEGQTLTQWMTDNPKPSLQQVREIIEQIAKGLLAFHRLEMLHQDLRPENVMIDSSGTVKIIDFGSAWVAGLEEISSSVTRNEILGTAQYTAPEYFIGEAGTSSSDQFSLAVIAYQMLSGRLPYGAAIARARSKKAQRSLQYQTVLADDRETPAWVDFTLRKALRIDPFKRYEVISEFLHDLRSPSKTYMTQNREPLMARNPVAFWQSLSAGLVSIILYLLYRLSI